MQAFKTLAAAAAIAVSTAAIATSASATTVIDNWTNVPNQPVTLTFSDNKISDPTGAGIYVNGADASDGTSYHEWDGTNFTDTFNFALPSGTVGFNLSSVSFVALSGLNFTSVTFNGVALTLTQVPNTFVWNAFTTSPLPVVAGGPQVLVVKGNGGVNASWSGTGAFAPAVVPEPGTWALMIMGFGGAGAMLRSRRRVAVAA
ncbi:MAG: PEP-CTERM sorting domain-containing protein [Phenylobacterium sp.]|uniref:FxDxF family PEP-CTERM protein n=1 Tax=Phenylobacterium sp. TaxID=1871053 RepID=UPI001A2D0DE2|nr:FxDxF family PEP-CTERM protein [Phenylobacterium sp.]MBJ7409562.1 PEP-CTERM sorting domain-containing protein [Phenylobacterium sp.]